MAPLLCIGYASGDELLERTGRQGVYERDDLDARIPVIYGGHFAWAKDWVNQDGVLARAC
jgi:hypothetical protein